MSEKVVCSGFACINQTVSHGFRFSYCPKCEIIRLQHQNSHRMEGHPVDIRMCPVCEMIPR